MNTDDTVWLSINGQKYGGWTGFRVTRGIELMPSSFQVQLTERYPDQPFVQIQPGQPVMVQIGPTIVLTGVIDRLMPSIDPRGHHITIIGRGRCRNLVDCSAIKDNSQFLNHTVLDIATAVAKPFGIVVTQRDPGTPPGPNEPLSADGQVIPYLNINLTTTPWQIIEEMARYASLLAYENQDGNVVLAQVGTVAAASGFASGVNVQAASATFGIDQRYSEIDAVALAVDSTLQLHAGAPSIDANIFPSTRRTAKDPGVPEYRPLVIVSEQGFAGLDFTLQRAQWEVARRYGRSQAVTLVVDSWRDADGNLWEPNTLAPVDIPEIRIGGVKWLISEVAFLVDEYRGRVAEVTLMPPEAFMPQPPVSLWDRQVTQAMREAAQ